MEFVRAIPFEEAVAKLGDRSVIGSWLKSTEWAGVPVALRDRAYFSATVESVRVLQRGRDMINDFLTGVREILPNGEVALKAGSRQEFVKQMQSFMESEGMIRKHGGLSDVASQRRLELIFDTQTRQAQEYGTWKQGQDPDVLDEFPAQRFIRVHSVNEARTSHAAFEGAVRLKSDLQFWQSINQDFGVPWGPWGWGCGHDVEDVDRAEAESLGLLQPGEPARPVDKSFNDQLKASTCGIDPDLQGVLKKQFGEQIQSEGDAVNWRGQE